MCVYIYIRENLYQTLSFWYAHTRALGGAEGWRDKVQRDKGAEGQKGRGAEELREWGAEGWRDWGAEGRNPR